ncbi:MAG: DUF362 domain-containing protein [Promethearchaeota archaeon]
MHPVAISSTGNIAHDITKALDEIGGLDTVISKGDIVLCKPNVQGSFSPGSGIITDAKVVHVVVKMVKKLGAIPVIGESSVYGRVTEECLHVSGMYEVAKMESVKIVDFDQDEIISVPITKGTVLKEVRTVKTVVESDVIIDIPVIKTHVATGVTLALKNMKGVLPRREKAKVHFAGLEEGIADLNATFTPDIVIADGIVGLEGLGPSRGTPVEMGLIVAGFEPVTVDSVCTKIMGMDPNEIKHIKHAYSKDLGEIDIDNMELYGKPIEAVEKTFKEPWLQLKEFKGIELLNGNACSGCLTELLRNLEYAKIDGRIDDLKNSTFYIGPDVQFDEKCEKNIFVGNCCKKFAEFGIFIEGCPPPGYVIREKLDEAGTK